MPDNVLKATIQVTAPGVKETFAQVANSTKVAETSLTQLGTTVTKTEAIVRQMPPAITQTSLTLKDQRSILVALQKQYAALSTQQAKSRFGLELAADIKIANAEIKRLEAGAVSSFGRIGTSATKGFSALRQLAFILPGLGIAGIFNLAFTAIDSVIQSLFSLNRGFKDGEIAAALFRQALDDISDSAAKLKSRLDFQDDISKLRASIAGLKGSDLDILDLGNRTKSAVEFITAEQKITDGLNEQKRQIIDVGEAYIKTGQASSKFLELAALAASGQVVPKTLIGQLEGREKSFADSYLAILKEVEASSKRSADAQSTIGENFLKTQEAQQKKQEELLKKKKSDYEKFVSDTIAQARKLEAAFKNIIDISPRFSVLDTKGEEFRKALGFVQAFDAGKLKITFRPDFDDKDIRNSLDLLGKKFSQVRFDIVLPIEFPIDPKVVPETQAEITRILKEVADIRIEPISLTGDISLDIAVRVDEAGKQFGADFAEAFRQEVKKNIAKGLDLSSAINAAIQRIGAIKQAIEGIQESFKSINVDALGNIGEAIGAALSGGDLEGIFSNFANIIGDGLQDIGKQMIRIGVVATLAKKALKTLFANPALTIAAGVLLIAAGAALKNLLGGGIRGFATGGRPKVGEPAWVGERGKEIFVPDRPGTIIPNHKIKDYSEIVKTDKVTSVSHVARYSDVSSNDKVKEISNSISRIVTTVLDKVARFQSTTLDKVASFHSSVSSSFEKVIGWRDSVKERETVASKEIRYVESNTGLKEIYKLFSDTKFESTATDSKLVQYSIQALKETYKLFSSDVTNNKSAQLTTASTSKELYSVTALKEISSTLSKVFDYSTAASTNTITQAVSSIFREKEKTVSEPGGKSVIEKYTISLSKLVNKDVSRETEKAKEVTKNFHSAFASLVNNSYEKTVSSAFDHLKELFSTKTSDKTDSVRESTNTQSNFQSLVTTSSIKELKELLSSYSEKGFKGVTTNNISDKQFSSSSSTESTILESVKQFTSRIVERFTATIERLLSSRLQAIPVSQITNITRAASTLNNLTKNVQFRAAGGPVSRNAPTIVGEKGWELFTPKVSGHIIPHHKVNEYLKNLYKSTATEKELRVFRSTRNIKDLNLSKIFNRRISNFSELTHKELSTIIGKQFAGFRAGGGFVGGGSTIAVGERNFELFVPNTGASIITNNNNAGGVGHVAGGTLKVEGNIRIAGSDLIAVISNASRSQSRLS